MQAETVEGGHLSLRRIVRRLAGRIREVARVSRDTIRVVSTIILRLVEVAILKLLHRSDYRRWTNPGSLEIWWESRTKLLAELVPPGSRVIEFGAGRRQLQRYLGPQCTYVAADLIDRGPGTIVCDLNQRPFPDLSGARLDVAVFGGVLEYIVDVPALLRWLGRAVPMCVASYACAPVGVRRLDRIVQRIGRTRHGYMNHFTEEKFVAIFSEAGYGCLARRTWQSQRLFLFAREERQAVASSPGTP